MSKETEPREAPARVNIPTSLWIAALVVGLVLSTLGFIVGSTVGDSGNALAAAIADDPAIASVSVSGDTIVDISFDVDATVEEIVAVRDRAEDAGQDPSYDVAGVRARRGHEIEAVAPTLLALAPLHIQNGMVLVREVEGIWVEVLLDDESLPAHGASVVLRILESFHDRGLPENLDVVGANTPGEQADLVFVTKDALRDLATTIHQLRTVAAQNPEGRIICDESGCAATPAT